MFERKKSFISQTLIALQTSNVLRILVCKKHNNSVIITDLYHKLSWDTTCFVARYTCVPKKKVPRIHLITDYENAIQLSKGTIILQRLHLLVVRQSTI